MNGNKLKNSSESYFHESSHHESKMVTTGTTARIAALVMALLAVAAVAAPAAGAPVREDPTPDAERGSIPGVAPTTNADFSGPVGGFDGPATGDAVDVPGPDAGPAPAAVDDGFDATASNAADGSGERDPVLLVHGFADTAETPWWDVLEDRLVAEGYDEDRISALSLGEIPLTTVDSPQDYAREVCNRVQAMADEHDSEVDVIAHSMGGLDTRWCVEKLGGAEYVDDLVTLGTPHQGTYMAYFAFPTPAGRDMIPGSDFLDRLNDGEMADSVEYTAVWSDWDELIAPDDYATIPAEERRSVSEARNVKVENVFHVELVWDEDVFERYVRYLD